MFLNIITPCSRPENLIKISESINIPKENYRWLVVFDSESLPDIELIPNNCESYCYKDLNSVSGNAQRNYAINLVDKGHVYFNDDDTTIDPNLWENVKDLDYDFISFSQLHSEGHLRLVGDVIEVGSIDSHNFIVTKELINGSFFILDRYDADGYFAKECRSKSKHHLFINKPLSVYNKLR
jgi:hypothetical protein